MREKGLFDGQKTVNNYHDLALTWCLAVLIKIKLLKSSVKLPAGYSES